MAQPIQIQTIFVTTCFAHNITLIECPQIYFKNNTCAVSRYWKSQRNRCCMTCDKNTFYANNAYFQNYWGSRLCPSSGILNTRKQNVKKTEYVSEKYSLLGCYAVWILFEQTFRRNISTPSGWQESLIIEAIRSSETSLLIRATRRNISEDAILHVSCCSVRASNLGEYRMFRNWILSARFYPSWKIGRKESEESAMCRMSRYMQITEGWGWPGKVSASYLCGR
jgi:hypothetical protein